MIKTWKINIVLINSTGWKEFVRLSFHILLTDEDNFNWSQEKYYHSNELIPNHSNYFIAKHTSLRQFIENKYKLEPLKRIRSDRCM